MAALVVGGITISVAAGSPPSEKRLQIGEVVRSFDGSPRSSVHAVATELPIVTTPMLSADANALLAVLEGAHPITCSGDLLGGSVSCTPTDIQVDWVHLGTARRKSVSFRLLGPP